MGTEVVYKDGELVLADNLEWLKRRDDNSVDLIFGSPPYEDARTYGIDFKLKDQDWVDWMVERWYEFDRVSSGLVAMVVEGRTENHKWTASPALLMADLHRAGFSLRKPPLYVRWGIPGSGGKDWLRNRYEFIICTSKGALPWSNNTACGKPPSFRPGGELSHRTLDGVRVNVKKKMGGTRGYKDGDTQTQKKYTQPDVANPGNLIDCGASGGGHIGSSIGHENEAPFPEKLADFFIRSFCPRNGIVLDPFSGSGTTVAAARKNRRKFIGIDIRESQIELAKKRLKEATMQKGFDLGE